MRLRNLNALMWVWIFYGAGLACAQTSSSIDRAEGLIKLDVVVTDGLGRPATGLSAADLAVLDNGKPQKILSFEQDAAGGWDAG